MRKLARSPWGINVFDDLVSEMFGHNPFNWEANIVTTPRTDPVQVTLTNDRSNYYIRAVVPGFAEDELDVSVRGNDITVSGKQERASEEKDYHSSSHVSFERTCRLHDDALVDDIMAEHKRGILLVTVPRKNAPTFESRQVPIKALETPKQE